MTSFDGGRCPKEMPREIEAMQYLWRGAQKNPQAEGYDERAYMELLFEFGVKEESVVCDNWLPQATGHAAPTKSGSLLDLSSSMAKVYASTPFFIFTMSML
eukprot:Gb_23358 [translate_table: standard]